MKTAIFLGAGASKAEGAPLQKDLRLFVSGCRHAHQVLTEEDSSQSRPTQGVTLHRCESRTKQKDEIKMRYDRFLGPEVVNYTDSSFEEFAENPGNFYR